MVQKSCHIACFSVCGKDQRIIDTQICDLPVAQCIEIFGGFLSGQKVIVINIDRVVRVLCRFSDKDIEKSLTEKKINDRVVHTGIKNNKSIHFTTSGHGTDCSQNLFFILPGDNGADILMGVTVVADSTDRLQVKRILISFFR